MLKNIKSSYFIPIIFSFIEEGQKLKIIKYNKNLQKNIDISIINYKHFQAKYIVYESKRVGKEYYGGSSDLIYEGEYLNGSRNEKGKEFDFINGRLIFEGEYLNGKRNGKGKKYNGMDELEYEGEYCNG